MAGLPGQFVAFQAFNAPMEAISGLGSSYITGSKVFAVVKSFDANIAIVGNSVLIAKNSSVMLY